MQKTLEKLATQLKEKTGNSCCIELESWFYLAKYPSEKDEIVTTFRVWDGFVSKQFKSLEEVEEYICRFQQR